MSKTWLSDKNGNRCSVKYFGSAEAAQKALDSLTCCSNCSNCSDCSGCSDCSDCSRCSRCWDCSDKKETPLSIPSIPNIHHSIYAAASQPEALDMTIYHTCEKTHCRAGWCITLAGPEGKALEAKYDSCLAAMMIYAANGYKISPVRFFEDNETALADMKRLADSEQARHAE